MCGFRACCCLGFFGLLTSFRCVNKFWLWYVLVFFSVKNEFFLGFDFEDVTCANCHGYTCKLKYVAIRSFKAIESISLSDVYPYFLFSYFLRIDSVTYIYKYIINLFI